MKTILGILLLCAAGVSAFGQGSVNLNNNFTPAGMNSKAYITSFGIPTAKSLGSVEILDTTGAVIRTGTLAIDGIFAFGIVEIPGIPIGGSGVIIIRAWDNSTGSTWGTAFARNQQVVTLAWVGGGTLPPPSLGAAGNFVGMELFIPEPSTYALAVLGLAGLFLVVRRR